jgi:CheY-like chemotaxis protein
MNPKILHFENDPMLLDFYSEIFKSAGFNYVYKETYQNLVNIVIEEKPDLIIVDILMPEISGFDAMRILKKDDKTKIFPFVVLSNMCDKDTIGESLKLGAIQFLCKSKYLPSDLINAIKKIIEENKKV